MSSYLEIEDALQVIDRYGFHIRDIGLIASRRPILNWS